MMSDRDSESTPKPPVQVNLQWATPALLISLIALMAVISFNLLTELRGVRAEIKADSRELKGDLRADIQEFRAERKDDVQKLRDEIKDHFREFRAVLKDATTEMKSDNRELSNHVDALANAFEADLKDSLTPINNRIDQMYHLQIPKTQ